MKRSSPTFVHHSLAWRPGLWEKFNFRFVLAKGWEKKRTDDPCFPEVSLSLFLADLPLISYLKVKKRAVFFGWWWLAKATQFNKVVEAEAKARVGKNTKAYWSGQGNFVLQHDETLEPRGPILSSRHIEKSRPGHKGHKWSSLTLPWQALAPRCWASSFSCSFNVYRLARLPSSHTHTQLGLTRDWTRRGKSRKMREKKTKKLESGAWLLSRRKEEKKSIFWWQRLFFLLKTGKHFKNLVGTQGQKSGGKTETHLRPTIWDWNLIGKRPLKLGGGKWKITANGCICRKMIATNFSSF